MSNDMNLGEASILPNNPCDDQYPHPTIGCCTVSELYPELIWARSQQRGWGFDREQIEQLRNELQTATGLVGVRVWRGRNLAYNWAESTGWLKERARGLGLEYQQSFDTVPEYYRFRGPAGKDPFLSVHEIDFSAWDHERGVVPNEIRKTRSYWPNLEVIDWLALNPGYLLQMDGRSTPFLMVPGFVVNSSYVLGIRRDGLQVGIRLGWADFGWDSAVAVGSTEGRIS